MNLMDELMAEMTRVKNLETEVNTTVKQLTDETGIARKEKANEIAEFLVKMMELLIQAKVIHDPSNPLCEYHSAIVKTGIYFQPKDSVDYNLKLRITGREVDVQTLRDASGSTLIYRGKLYGFFSDCVEYLIDQWSQATYDAVENQIAEIIKKAIAKRIEEATEKLKTANEKHDNYYGKER